MDGANPMQIFSRIFLPLSKPVLAAFGLFYAVGHWNSYFNAILFMNNPDKWPTQVFLRLIVIVNKPRFRNIACRDRESSSAGNGSDGSHIPCNRTDFNCVSVSAKTFCERGDKSLSNYLPYPSKWAPSVLDNGYAKSQTAKQYADYVLDLEKKRISPKVKN
jgi:hypothetical protein